MEALNNIVEEVMFKVTRRTNQLLKSPEFAGLTQKQQIATMTQLVAACLPQALQEVT